MFLQTEYFMLKNPLRSPVKACLLASFIVLILIIGLLDVHGQKDPEIFKIISLNASTDQNAYVRNDIIRVDFSLNCSGIGLENKFLILALNDSFRFKYSDIYKPNVDYPDGIGLQTANYSFENETRAPNIITFKKLKVWLHEVNDDEKNVYRTNITCNISPTLKCNINRTYDLTDRSFITLSPKCDERHPCKIDVKNMNPEIIEFNDSFDERTGAYRVRFGVRDNDSHTLSWVLCKNGIEIEGLTGNISGDPPLIINGLSYDSCEAELPLVPLVLHIRDSDGGENWSTVWAPIIGSGSEYKQFLFLILIIIVLLTAISYTREDPLIGSIFSICLLIPVIFVYYLWFEWDFLLLFISFLLALLLSNYALSSLSEIQSEPNYRIVVGNCRSHSNIDKIVFSFLNAIVPSWLASIRIRALGLSFLWITIVMAIIILNSSKVHTQTDLNYFSIMAALFVLILPKFIIKPEQCHRPILYILEMIILIMWMYGLLYYIAELNVKHYGGNGSEFVLFITFTSVILLPLHISIYLQAKKRKKHLDAKSNSYVFSWNEIPEEGNRRLKKFLTTKLGLDWVKNAEIIKIDDKTIRISANKNSLLLKLNDEKTEVILEIDGFKKYEFIAKMENGMLDIYSNSI